MSTSQNDEGTGNSRPGPAYEWIVKMGIPLIIVGLGSYFFHDYKSDQEYKQRQQKFNEQHLREYYELRQDVRRNSIIIDREHEGYGYVPPNPNPWRNEGVDTLYGFLTKKSYQ